MRTKGCLSVICSIFTVIILILTLIFPWYFLKEITQIDNETCTALRFFGWMTVYCTDSNCQSSNFTESRTPCSVSQYDWRTTSENDPFQGTSTKNRVNLTNIAGLKLKLKILYSIFKKLLISNSHFNRNRNFSFPCFSYWSHYAMCM